MNRTRRKVLGVDIPVRVLVIPNPKTGLGRAKYACVVLEMDIWGFGETKQEAKREVEDLLEIQIEASLGKGFPEVMEKPTNKEWFDLWESLERKGRNDSAPNVAWAELRGSPTEQGQYSAVSMVA